MARPIEPNLIAENARSRWGVHMLLVLVVIAYLPALNGDFITDDFDMIKSPKVIDSLGAMADIFATGFTFDPDNEPTPKASREQVSYRPVSISILLIQKTLFGSNPLPYHLFNLCLHLLACLIALRLARHWFMSTWSQFLGVSFFALHPFSTDAVAWINGLSDPLVFLSLGAIALTIIHTQTLWKLVLTGFLGLFVGLLCKETAAVFIVAAPLIAWLEFRRYQPVLAVTAASIAALLTYGILRHWALGSSGSAGMPVSFEKWAFVLQAPAFIVWMTYKLFTLLDLTLHMRNTAISHGHGLWISAFGAFSYLSAILWTVRAALRRRFGSGLIFTLLFLIFMMPIAYQHSVFHASPRSLYIPCFFLGMMLSCFFDDGMSSSPRLFALQKGFICAITAFLFLSTFLRSFDYRSDNHIMAADLQENANDFQAHYYYAKRLMRRKRFTAAEEVAQRAVELNPGHIRAQNNLAYCYLNLGKRNLAFERYQHILTMDKDHCNARYHLGLIESHRNRLDAARQHLKEVSQSCYNYARSVDLLAKLER